MCTKNLRLKIEPRAESVARHDDMGGDKPIARLDFEEALSVFSGAKEGKDVHVNSYFIVRSDNS